MTGVEFVHEFPRPSLSGAVFESRALVPRDCLGTDCGKMRADLVGDGPLERPVPSDLDCRSDADVRPACDQHLGHSPRGLN